MKIIGIGGLPRSGKDTLAELFIGNGYYGVSLGDIVRNISRDRHVDKPDPISVANMTETSNFLRTERGADFAIKEAIELYEKAIKSKDYKGLVVYSVRAPIEVDSILAQGGDVIWVEADDEVRLSRANSNLRPGELEQTLDKMLEDESLQAKPQPGLPSEVQMNTNYVSNNATITLTNNDSDIEGFQNYAEEVLSKYLK